MRTAQTAAQVIATMKAIVEAPGYPYLSHYKDDFYKGDVDKINEVWGSRVQYLWIVKPTGTELTRLGVHPRQNERALATYECGMKSNSLGVDAYIVSDRGVKPVTESQVRDAAKAYTYVVTYNTVRVLGELIAGLDVRRVRKPGNGNQYVHAVLQSPCLERLSVADLGALRDIVAYEGVALWSSLFVQTEVLDINGFDLNDLMTSRREAQQLRLRLLPQEVASA